MNVTIYTSATCHFCHLVKDWMKKNKISFEEKPVEEGKNAEEAVEKSGQMGVPVTDVNGTIVVGFDEKKLKELLKK